MIKIDLKPDAAQLKSFGFVALFGFSAMASMVAWQFTGWDHWIVWTLFGLAAVCPLFSLVAPVLNKPVYVTLMLLAIPIGLVVSAVVLRAIYYGLFTPLALWFRIRGRDAMHRKLEPALATYWTDHRDRVNPRSPASYLRLY